MRYLIGLVIMVSINAMSIYKYLDVVEQEQRLGDMLPGVASAYYYEGCQQSIKNLCWYTDCGTELQKFAFQYCDEMSDEAKLKYKEEE